MRLERSDVTSDLMSAVSAVSIADLIRSSERLELQQGLVLLLPPGRSQQEFLMNRDARVKLAAVMPDTILNSGVLYGERINRHGARIFLVAPGDWNSHRGYGVLICSSGTTVMTSLGSCGYEPDKKGYWRLR